MISRSPTPSSSGAASPGIARSATSRPAAPAPAWQRELAAGVRTVGELLALLELPPEAAGEAGASGAAERQFPVRVPRGFAARMRRRDPRDPLLLQVLATAAEDEEVPGYGPDPLAESAAAPLPGVLHKYRNRVLLVATGACAVHCRYCFRRHFPYGEQGLSGAGWDAALDYLATDRQIDEVILSGGDPLTLGDERLAALAARLAAVPHLARLRIHTRLPVVLPQRVGTPLLAWLTGGRLAPVVVVHANHPREIDAAVAAALRRLRAAGVTVLNQSVLLAGINDDAATLAELSRRLFAAGTLPYYLHLLDPVAGAAHFAVGEASARHLARRLAESLPGYLVPRLVRELPGAPAKEPVPLDARADTSDHVEPRP
ncbi:MAG TPA: EF-P beta-lysylation protein EpmB [Thermoanaerobaculia bacterium]|nr:EF-P beta-lysylation protein EpmB [Thermoanaerobaculia bacterium]